MGQVFLSYSRKDVDVMHRVRDALQAAKLDVWTDTSLEPGTPAWQSAIGEGYRGCASHGCAAFS